jgi:hypothetical protein
LPNEELHNGNIEQGQTLIVQHAKKKTHKIVPIKRYAKDILRYKKRSGNKSGRFGNVPAKEDSHQEVA